MCQSHAALALSHSLARALAVVSALSTASCCFFLHCQATQATYSAVLRENVATLAVNGLHKLSCCIPREQKGLLLQHTTESHCKTGSHRGGGNTRCTPHTSYQCRNAISPQSNKNSAAVTMPLDSYQLEFHGRLNMFLHAQEQSLQNRNSSCSMLIPCIP